MTSTPTSRAAARRPLVAGFVGILLLVTAGAALAQTEVTTPDTGGNVGWSPAIALDAAGNPVIAHRDRDQDDLRVLHCDDPVCGGTEPASVPDSAGRTGLAPRIALDPAGNPIVAYHTLASQDAPDLAEGVVVLHCGDPRCAGPATRTFLPATTSSAFALDLQIGADGHPILAWSGPDDGVAVVVDCDDPACSGDSPVVVTAEGAVGTVAMALTPQGNPVVVHGVAGDGTAAAQTVVVTCGDPGCTSAQRDALDIGPAVGAASVQDVVVTADGVPTILLATVDPSGIVVARCGDPGCGTASTTTLSATEDFAVVQGDMALADDGHPVVAFNQPSGELQVVDCADAGCGGSSTSTPSRGGPGHGLFAAIVTPPDGGLVVASYDQPDGDLVVVRCASTRCASPPQPAAAAVDVSQQRVPPSPDFGGAWAGGAGTHGAPASHVVIATVEGFADALSGAVLAQDGPLLLTPTASLDPAVAGEVDRVLGRSGTVYVLGGESAISTAVVDELSAAGYDVERLAGASRFETSTAIATAARERYGDTGEIALARAFGPEGNPTAAWADSVTGGGWAADTGTPVVLTTSDALHPAVAAWVDDDQPDVTHLLGGSAALSADFDELPGASRTAGDTRFDTARQIAAQLWGQAEEGPRTYLVLDATTPSGWAFGLPAAGLAADLDAPLLAVGDQVPPESAAAVEGCGEQVALIPAGPVDDAVMSALDGADSGACSG